jgi:20S proteasome alpha/beta subunit
MTVCIAALCGVGHERGPFIIAAADRMITIGDLEYEPAQTKTVNLAPHTIALFAGDMQLHASVVPKVLQKVKEATLERTLSVAEVAEFYAEEYAYYRRLLAERTVLFPRGLNFDRFLTRQSTMSHHEVSKLDDLLATYFVDSSAIIAGIDGTGGHLYRIENPGVAVCYDTPYFAAIGSGEHLATTQFMFSRFDKTWDFASGLWLAFYAKARAEAAGGVGRQTDVVIITPENKIFPLTQEHKEFLYALFDTAVAKERAASSEAIAEIEKYIKSLGRMTNSGEAAEVEQTAAENNVPEKVKSEDRGRKKHKR